MRRLGLASIVGIALLVAGAGAALAITQQQAYLQKCTSCHCPNGEGLIGPALVGTGSLANYTTAAELFTNVRANMPLLSPDSLSEQMYYDIVAWEVSARGVPLDGTELSAATIAATPLNPPASRTLTVTVAQHVAPSRNLAHNLLDLQVVLGGEAVSWGFERHYDANGGLERWGFPASEVLEERTNVFTQYYQLGVVDCQKRAGAWRTERRLAWDYVGGGVAGAPDLGVEPGLTNPNPGEAVGPWDHRVSNQAIDGTATGFLDFFMRLGGTSSFGFPKTDARRDDDPRSVLHVPGATPGFIRQYFQSAVVEFHPGDPAPVKLRLLGDDLRNRHYPNKSYEAFASFKAAPPVAVGASYVPERTTPST
ncbi:MAG: cytochrome c [Actinobacteria bacterium]|nr:cytochrome c [Actinomycetota bacterium]